jgi:hypothetical protein
MCRCAWADNQWLRVDLGAAKPVARVTIRWEAAYGRTYRIETSPDGATWTAVATVTDGNGVNARYLRLYGQTRATSYGFSVYELETYAH